MSPREKKLLIFFATAGFIVVNFLAYAWFQGESGRIRGELADAKLAVERARLLSVSRELVAHQMEWLAEHEPAPVAYQDAQATLQQLVEQQARTTGLTIKQGTQRLLPVDDSGVHYHRARVELEVIGREEALYRWLYQIKSPEDLRTTTFIGLRPNREDDTLIECRAIIEQWFIPAAPEA
ncbi:MAG: hypothetical protein ACNA8L_08565 [Luteolibacter sp.]|jgi:hypothetical protein